MSASLTQEGKIRGQSHDAGSDHLRPGCAVGEASQIATIEIHEHEENAHDEVNRVSGLVAAAISQAMVERHLARISEGERAEHHGIEVLANLRDALNRLAKSEKQPDIEYVKHQPGDPQQHDYAVVRRVKKNVDELPGEIQGDGYQGQTVSLILIAFEGHQNVGQHPEHR